MDKDGKAPPSVANADDEDVSREVYLGVVKSYNDRRGFGFLACAETADRFGRDVYMPKAWFSKCHHVAACGTMTLCLCCLR